MDEQDEFFSIFIKSSLAFCDLLRKDEQKSSLASAEDARRPSADPSLAPLLGWRGMALFLIWRSDPRAFR
jgi:hypothetical protein